MYADSESAKRALRELNNSDLEGRRLFLREVGPVCIFVCLSVCVFSSEGDVLESLVDKTLVLHELVMCHRTSVFVLLLGAVYIHVARLLSQLLW